VNHTLILKLATTKSLGTQQIGRKLAGEEPRRAPGSMPPNNGTPRRLMAAGPEPVDLIVANHWFRAVLSFGVSTGQGTQTCKEQP
jgi:hypothetical protein